MIKNILCLVTVLSFTVSSYAQEFKEVMRYEYKMTYRPQTEKDTLIEDITFLDVWDNNSRFASEERVKFIEFVSDDKNAIFRRETLWGPNKETSGQNWMIQKEQQSVYYYNRVGSTFLKTKEILNTITWNITEELSNYEGMQVQKATGDYKGRSWTVWFTKEIPLLEGPYKFKNLPGFVVKAASADGDYLFEFNKSEKAQTVLKYHNYENAAEINDVELKKLRKLVANKSKRQIYAEQGVTMNIIDNPEFERDLNKKQGDSNNYIEKL
ncbi:GLPGLI family protein [Myroides guanonis]|uniref:GLPGLI family protein n=1 Tax=Myroides guanonis TaxID=1150112 RepID=A0A1I3NAK0_9FLAO|nr:GLPGLI family protein [Myroides guanonis]SFJ06338.1 GLPGLI family protein [Myroides guanonis]